MAAPVGAGAPPEGSPARPDRPVDPRPDGTPRPGGTAGRVPRAPGRASAPPRLRASASPVRAPGR